MISFFLWWVRHRLLPQIYIAIMLNYARELHNIHIRYCKWILLFCFSGWGLALCSRMHNRQPQFLLDPWLVLGLQEEERFVEFERAQKKSIFDSLFG